MVMNADKKSSQTQIAQATFDETNQSVKVIYTVNGTPVSQTNPLPVTIDNQTITVDVGLDKANDSVQIAGTDGTTPRVVSTDTTGKLNVNNISGSISLPTGASTELTLSSVNNKLPTLGQKTKIDSVSVTLASDQENINVNTPAVVDAGNSTTSPLNISGIFTGAAFDAKDFATLSISITSDVSSITDGLSVQFSQNGTNWDHVHTFTFTAGGNGLSYNLPVEMRYVRVVYTNGAVAQTSFRLQSIFRRTQVPPSVYTISQGIYEDTIASPVKSVIYGKTTGMGGGYVAVKVNPSGALTTEVSGTVAATQSGTWNINNISGVISLPTGASTANNQSLMLTEVQRLDANHLLRRNYVSSPVNTVDGYVQLVALLTSAAKEIEIFDSSGETLVLAIGAAASEVDKVYVIPGGNGKIPVKIAASSRLSIKAISGNATSGELIINFYG